MTTPTYTEANVRALVEAASKLLAWNDAEWDEDWDEMEQNCSALFEQMNIALAPFSEGQS